MSNDENLPNWIIVNSDGDFESNLKRADPKILVVAYFFSPTCPHCTAMTPKILAMADVYTTVTFLKTDVYKCPKMSTAYKIMFTPTCVLIRSQRELMRVEGQDPGKLQESIKRYQNMESKDLLNYVDQQKFRCFNEGGEISPSQTLLKRKSWLPLYDGAIKIIESGLNSRLIIHIPFRQPVTPEAVVIRGPLASGPKNVLVFVNQPEGTNPDFNALMKQTPEERMTLDTKDLDGSNYRVQLKTGRGYQSINTLTLVVTDNQSESGVTRMDYLAFIGKPV